MTINVYVVTASAWQQSEAGVRIAIGTLDATAPRAGSVVKLDLAAVHRLPSVEGGAAAATIPLSTLVRHGSSEYEADAEAIKTMLVGLSAGDGRPGVVDASAFDTSVTRKVLACIRVHAYSMDAWPASLTVVCPDDAVEEVVDLLAGSFLVVPSRRSIAEASTYAMRVHRAATYARVFMWSQSATGRAFKLRDRIDRLTKALFKRDAADMVR